MSNNMTRAEAICACINIIDLAAELSEIIPYDFYTRAHDFATSLSARVQDSPQYPNVTESMDRAIRNYWNGLRKWDHKDEYSDDLFQGFTQVVEELVEVLAPPENGPVVTPKGREAPEAPPVLSEKQQAVLSSKLPPKPPPAPEKPRVDDTMPEWMKTEKEKGAAAPGFRLEDILKAKENAVSKVLSRARGSNLRVVPSEEIRMANVEVTLSHTKSDRTRQLIMAAYYQGQIVGINLLTDDLRTKT